MVATPDYYDRITEAFPDTESLTVLVVAGATREQVAGILRIDLGTPARDALAEDSTGWALVEIPGGVLATEPTGYGDPTCDALRELSSVGSAAAVVRHNIQAHLRFGCARGGELLFDDDEYIYIDDPEVVPADLRPLFDLVWDDLEDGEDDFDDGPDPFAVGLAMAELVTGVELTTEHVARVSQADMFEAPTLVYASALDE